MWFIFDCREVCGKHGGKRYHKLSDGVYIILVKRARVVKEAAIISTSRGGGDLRVGIYETHFRQVTYSRC